MGYLAFFDAPKKTAKTSVEALKRLKVTPKILTGDQADVAVSVCRRVGIPSETVLTGAQMDEMTDAVLGAALKNPCFCGADTGAKGASGFRLEPKWAYCRIFGGWH